MSRRNSGYFVSHPVFFMHRTQTLAFASKAANGNIPTYKNSEWQADVFARNLLAPYSMTRGMIAQQIEILFGVSKSVAEIIAGTQSSPNFSTTSTALVQMTFPF